MQKITGNEPAHPHGAWGQQTGTGLTIRQYFAAMAMQGLIAANYSDISGNVKVAVQHADALISELNAEK